MISPVQSCQLLCCEQRQLWPQWPKVIPPLKKTPKIQLESHENTSPVSSLCWPVPALKKEQQLQTLSFFHQGDFRLVVSLVYWLKLFVWYFQSNSKTCFWKGGLLRKKLSGHLTIIGTVWQSSWASYLERWNFFSHDYILHDSFSNTFSVRGERGGLLPRWSHLALNDDPTRAWCAVLWRLD